MDFLASEHILLVTVRLTGSQGKRLFLKDMASTILPPEGKPAAIAPSLGRLKRGVGTNSTKSADTNHTQIHPYPYNTEAEPNNPTVVPREILEKFHITFLIRHPRSAIPSYYRCCIPPLDEKTGFRGFLPSEAGYAELRRLFDYLRYTGQIGPDVAGQSKATHDMSGVNGHSSGVQICVVDADDLLDNPSGIVEAFCMSVGLEYNAGMLDWSEEDQKHATEVFSKWNGFHDDAIQSTSLKPRAHVSLRALHIHHTDGQSNKAKM